MEPGRGSAPAPGELEGRIGSRVLPESFDVVDDPAQKEWRGRPLFGSYDVDREGVLAKPLSLVEKGVLKNYLLTRQPVQGFEGSNGRARMPGAYGASTAAFSNLFVSSSETAPPGGAEEKADRVWSRRATSPMASSCAKWISPLGGPRRSRRAAPGRAGQRASGELADLAYKSVPGRPRGAGARAAFPRA